jgi:hypothetical protein
MNFYNYFNIWLENILMDALCFLKMLSDQRLDRSIVPTQVDTLDRRGHGAAGRAMLMGPRAAAVAATTNRLFGAPEPRTTPFIAGPAAARQLSAHPPHVVVGVGVAVAVGVAVGMDDASGVDGQHGAAEQRGDQ